MQANLHYSYIGIDKGAVVENLSLNHIVQENLLPKQFPLYISSIDKQ